MIGVRALITNDDGIDSPGLVALARGALAAGFEVIVAAPHVDSTGVGASVFAVVEDRRVRVHEAALPGVDAPAWSVEGHPAFIVHSAFEGWLEQAPDIVLSGINIGANVGLSVIHSGTVGAALTASMHGCSALATSLDCGLDGAADAHWEAVVDLLPRALELLTARPAGTVLSLNAPDLPSAELGPLREATLASVGAVQVRIAHTAGVDGAPATWQATVTSPDEPHEPGTDVALLAAGHPTISELRTVSAVPGLL
ncbi:5'-nucleotidase [Pseudonocardia oroxyli]|uniref:5'-nucleotidase n=1 Tax=Pseudonocardia oroxyli TaxID=366584 RepID=A0A1G7PIG3_PSEOR|nr:5'-nucleotidase [Pseudonocardia oroxyli]